MPSTLQAAVELEREAARKLAYFLNLLRRHLPAQGRFSADTCRYITVSMLAAIHVVRLAVVCPSAAAIKIIRPLHSCSFQRGSVVKLCLQARGLQPTG